MDERQKSRLIMLAISGILLGGGTSGYFWYQNQKDAAAEIDEQLEQQSYKARAATSSAKSKSLSTVVKSAGQPPAPGQSQPLGQNQLLGQAQPLGKPLTTFTTTTTTVLSQPNPGSTGPGTTANTGPAGLNNPGLAASTNTGLGAGPNEYAATPREAAVAQAQSAKRRNQPTEPIAGFSPFGGISVLKPSRDAIAMMAPPPPPSDKPMKPRKINERLVPPPPPVEATGMIANMGEMGLPIDQLPVPPSRPTIGDKVRVIGVFDDKAILAFPRSMQIKNRWPRTITLGTGEQFESLTIVSINHDGVTIEEDGERSMKPIAAIK